MTMIDYIPYVLNVVVLAPALVLLMQGKIDVFPQSENKSDVRIVVVSLWLGVLLTSLIALLDPAPFWPVLAYQLIYNLIFGVLWIWPSLIGRTKTPVPWGASLVFAIVMLTWPYFIFAALQ